MRRGHYLSVALVVLLTAILSACGGSSSSSSSATVTISPNSAVVVLGGIQQFSATVSGPSNTAVNWSISGTGCSGSSCGTINTSGVYTAPKTLPSATNITVVATSQAVSTAKASATITIDSGVRVQISPTTGVLAPSETLPISATVTGTTDTQVTWTVNGTPNGTPSSGQICVLNSNPCQSPTGPTNNVYYQAPSSVPASGQETVAAVSSADSSKSGSLVLNILTGVDPIVASISPTSAPQGAVNETVYVTAQSPSNFFSTSTVLANGQAVPTTFVNTTLIRGLVPAALFQTAGKVDITVQRQNGDISNAIAVQVHPERPAVISFSPVSVPQCPTGGCGAASVTLDGGYFSPSTTVEFNGQTVGANLVGPNRISVPIPATSLEKAGLYQLAVRNPGAVLPEAAVNVAVEPSLASNAATIVDHATVGSQPSAVAIDQATGMAVVANTGAGSVSLVNLPACSGGSCPATTVAVGSQPTGVAVDWVKDWAIVVNQGGPSLSVVDLASQKVIQTIPLPTGYVPVSIGENPLTQHALVANQETNTVTVVDLSKSPAAVTTLDVTQGGTRPGGMGISPEVEVVPRLDWAIVTPGGAGAITAIDMSHQSIDPSTGILSYNIVFSFTLSTSVRGIALDPVTDSILLADPRSTSLTIFNLLNESVKSVYNGTSVVLTSGNVAAAVSPLTNVGLVVNQQTNSVQLVDLGNAQLIGSPIVVGTTPVAAAVDNVTNQAIVVNQGGSNATVISLGAVRPLSLLQASASQMFTSTAAETLTLIGSGFQSGASVRVDGVAIPSSDVLVSSDREITATLPASLLSGPRLLNLDVENTSGDVSNILQVPVIQAIPVGSSPVAVAVDPSAGTAVVTNSGSNTVSLIDLATRTVTNTLQVGENPQAVAMIPRLSDAVVADTNDNSASVVTLSTSPPAATVIPLSSTGGTSLGPIAVDVDQDTGLAWIANDQSNNVSLLNVEAGTIGQSVGVDQGPLGVSVDPNVDRAAVLCSTQTPPTIDIVNTQETSAFLTAHLAGADLPIGIALDPVNNWFLVADSAGNRVLLVDPVNSDFVQNIATGINPTSIAYNYQATEAVTVNTASHTASLVEISPSGSQVRSLIRADGSSQQSVAIDPIDNLILVVDQANNRLLLVPAPH